MLQTQKVPCPVIPLPEATEHFKLSFKKRPYRSVVSNFSSSQRTFFRTALHSWLIGEPETSEGSTSLQPTFRMYEVGLIDGGAVSTHSATLINWCVSVLPPEEQRFAIRLPVPSTRTEPTHSEGFQAAACPPWPLEPATFNPVLTRCVSAVKGAF